MASASAFAGLVSAHSVQPRAPPAASGSRFLAVEFVVETFACTFPFAVFAAFAVVAFVVAVAVVVAAAAIAAAAFAFVVSCCSYSCLGLGIADVAEDVGNCWYSEGDSY